MWQSYMQHGPASTRVFRLNYSHIQSFNINNTCVSRHSDLRYHANCQNNMSLEGQFVQKLYRHNLTIAIYRKWFNLEYQVSSKLSSLQFTVSEIFNTGCSRIIARMVAHNLELKWAIDREIILDLVNLWHKIINICSK